MFYQSVKDAYIKKTTKKKNLFETDICQNSNFCHWSQYYEIHGISFYKYLDK